MPRHILRWDFLGSVSNWKDTIDNRMVTFIKKRPCAVEKNLVEFFDISTFDFHCVDSSVETSNKRFILAPNPNKGHFYIYNNWSDDFTGEIIVTDIVGKTIYRKHDISLIKNEKTYFDFSYLPSNIYLLIFKNKDFREVRKFILIN